MAVPPTADGHSMAAELRQMGDRLAKLLDSALEQPEVRADQARLILQEMATGMEEMRVAEEELTVQAEQLLASHAAVGRERERYAELFEFAPDAYLVTDARGKILEANGTAERLLGVSLRHLSGKLVQSFIGSNDLRAVRTLLNDLGVGSGAARTIELELVPREKDPVPVEARVAAHFDPEPGDLGELHVWWLLRDISERLRTDREVRQLHTDVELLEALARVNRLTIETPDPEELMLQGLVDLAARISGGASAGIILTDAKDRIEARAVSSDVARRLCEIQADEGGPATEALGDGKPRLHVAGADGQWPVLDRLMAELGMVWALSHPIPLEGPLNGVFILFGMGPVEAVQHEIEILAAHAGWVITNGRLYHSATELAGHLATALESRGVIEQAKGILMAWQGCGADRAFDILRRASQRENRKLRVVAEEIVARAAKSHPTT